MSCGGGAECWAGYTRQCAVYYSMCIITCIISMHTWLIIRVHLHFNTCMYYYYTHCYNIVHIMCTVCMYAHYCMCTVCMYAHYCMCTVCMYSHYCMCTVFTLTVGCKMATSELVMLLRNKGSSILSLTGEHRHSSCYWSKAYQCCACPAGMELQMWPMKLVSNWFDCISSPNLTMIT